MRKKIFAVILALLILLAAGCTDNGGEQGAPYSGNALFSKFM